jgi:hypothetical protein
MVVLNAFVLAGHGEAAVYRWFMELCAIDAYDWVMSGNLGSMGGYVPGVARKPYVSGSAYIARMSAGYDGAGWRDRWDALFYAAVPRFPYFRRVLEGRRYLSRKREWKRVHRETVARIGPGAPA